jgi:chromosome segregation ATPase
MPEEKEKVEDFVSLWRKKMKTEIDKPSAIGDTLDKIKEVEKENEDLRKKITDNIELITKTEEIIKKTIDENERLKEEIKNSGMIDGVKASDLQQQNIDLANQIRTITTNLSGKEEQLNIALTEITELKKQKEDLIIAQKSIPEVVHAPDPTVTSEIIENLQSEISKKKAVIEDLEKKNVVLIAENEKLKEETNRLSAEVNRRPEIPVPAKIKPLPAETSPQTLEILCQDLQSDLNKYKRIVEKLTTEKSELQRNVESGGIQLEPEELNELKLENQNLKNELSKLQESLKKKAEQESTATSLDDLNEKIYSLQNQLKERDHLIAELKMASETPTLVQKGPMSDLIEDLQSKINKLKIALEEKNKIIEEIKSS